MLMRFFRTPGLSASVLAGIMSRMPFLMGRLQTEICFYIEVTQALAEDELEKLKWLLRKTYEPRGLSLQSFLSGQKTVYESDCSVYCRLFAEDLQRNPPDVELGQIGNGNADHSRHNTFGGRYVIDGQLFEESLMDIIKKPWLGNPGNSVLAFEGNCSAIRGFETPLLVPAKPGEASCLIVAKRVGHL